MLVFRENFYEVFLRGRVKCRGVHYKTFNAFTKRKWRFLPRDATQSAVMPQYVVCLSVRPSVGGVHVP